MRSLRLAAVVAASLAAGACLQSTTLIRINADGSGTIEQTTIMTDAALRQLRQLAAMGGDTGKPIDFFSTKQAHDMAASLGPGVTVVSSTRIKNADGEGSKAIFAFADIGQLDIKHRGAGPVTPGMAAAPVRFSLTHEPDDRAILHITLQQANLVAVNPPTAPAGSSGTAKSRMPPEQLAMIKQMFAGMRVTVAVEPAGQLLKTSSPFVDGQRVTLLELAFDQLIANEAAFSRAQAARSIDDVREALKDVPGLKINLAPEITIEFAGR